MGPLTGKLVLDLSQLIAGPSTALMLADLGAEVIKVESPIGDQMRRMGSKLSGEESAGWIAYNRNKKNIVLDLKKREGKKVFEQLVEKADIIVLAFRPGVPERLGIDYETVSKINPQIIYCNFIPFGEEGPYAHRSGVDTIWQAESGLMSINGELNGDPLRVGFTAVDVVGGHWGAQSVLAALLMRQQTNQGSEIKISLFDVAVTMQAWQITEYLVSGKLPVRSGNGALVSAPQGLFRTKDQPIVLSAYFEDMFCKLCNIIGKPELADDPRFKTNEVRIQHKAELEAMIEESLLERTAKEWIDLFEEEGILCGRVQDYHDLINDPQLNHDKIFGEVDHPSLGPLPVISAPLKSECLYQSDYKPSPQKGEHTADILKEVGYSDSEIDILKTKKAVE
jgi:crotonobetainyl-CoA:carnitine CoA-transferase CaiB-like acyl-CoA transferase